MTSRTSYIFRRARVAQCALACLLLTAEVAGAVVQVRHQMGDAGAELFGQFSAPAQARAARLRIFDEVWELVLTRYYDANLHGVDWQEARRTFRPLAAEAQSPEEFYRTLRRMLGLLQDPHTRVFAPGESTDWRTTRFVSVGLNLREIAGELVVTHVERDSEAGRAGVRVGETLLSIDGEAATAILARRISEQPGRDSEAARILAAAKLFDGPRDSYASARFRPNAANARERVVRLRREFRARTPELRVERLRSDIGVARFNIFTAEIAARLARSLAGELKDVRSLIIDLRDNGGGETETMADIASIFLPAGMSLGRFTDRQGRILVEPQTRSMMLTTANTLTRFRGALVIITGARTASASEVLIAALKERGRATVVGEETCGCVLGIRRRHTLPDGGILDISEMDYYTAGGKHLEGDGLEPDERVTLTRRDLLAGRDPAIERALSILKDKDGK